METSMSDVVGAVDLPEALFWSPLPLNRGSIEVSNYKRA